LSLSAPQHFVTQLCNIAARHAEPACTATY